MDTDKATIFTMLTDQCNANCPFCFSKLNLTHTKHQLTLADLQLILNVFTRWEISPEHSTFPIAGGEPTLNKEFESIIETIQRAGFKNILFLTNGIMEKHKAEFLAQYSNIIYLVNCVEQIMTDSTASEKLSYFLDNASPSSQSITLGTTIFREEQDLSYLLRTAIQHDINRFRIGLAQPVYAKNGAIKNTFLDLQQCKNVSEKIVSFVESCADNQVEIYFDCHFPRCMFSENQRDRLWNAQNRTPDFIKECTGQPCLITPNHLLTICFTAAEILAPKHIADFNSLADIYSYIQPTFEFYAAKPGFSECVECADFMQKCSGGCLGHKVRYYCMHQQKSVESYSEGCR